MFPISQSECSDHNPNCESGIRGVQGTISVTMISRKSLKTVSKLIGLQWFGSSFCLEILIIIAHQFKMTQHWYEFINQKLYPMIKRVYNNQSAAFIINFFFVYSQYLFLGKTRPQQGTFNNLSIRHHCMAYKHLYVIYIYKPAFSLKFFCSFFFFTRYQIYPFKVLSTMFDLSFTYNWFI